MSKAPFQPLTEDEIQSFWDDLELSPADGRLYITELDSKLEAVHRELAPLPKLHNLNHPSRKTPRSEKIEDNDLHDFLRGFLPDSSDSVNKEEFFAILRSWNIPSQQQINSKEVEDEAAEYDRKLPLGRRARAWWSVHGLQSCFLLFVFALQLGFGLWQFLIYLEDSRTRHIFGWGLILAKFCAGVLYPTLFFMILSMSRWFATFCRKSYTVSRFVNWDYSQTFHINMAICATFFALLHTLGHLAGTFVYGSRPAQRDNIVALLGNRAQFTYAGWIRTRPGWTGLTALICFLIIGATSNPRLKKKHYEIFQAAHFLMYVVFAMLAAHGTEQLFQVSMLGYWIAIPVLLVLAERTTRLVRGIAPHPARLEALDDGTVVITAEKPDEMVWQVRAGQFVFVQVPEISRFQWHPFTVSTCIGPRLQVHIKADGDWTRQLHALARSKVRSADEDFLTIKVGIDGPYGAPAQSFSRFDKAIIVGAGIGVTPFSAILTDLEEKHRAKGDPWQLTDTRDFGRELDSPALTAVNTRQSEVTKVEKEEVKVKHTGRISDMRRSKPGVSTGHRVDFHWSVREKNDLLWFSDLLNRASALAASNSDGNLTLNIHAHITAPRKNISTHVFRYLLDSYRTKEYPYSALTGLAASSHFGRPDFPRILREYYDDMKAQEWQGPVGVFFCGPPVIGKVLADQCAQMTARAQKEGSRMRFVMMIEVFG